jgi:endonuclease/exonuclease/phosphatase family metal-dependent hydrolase
MDRIRAPIAFTVRVTTGEEQKVSAIVQCVRTGERHRVRGGRAIGALITRLAKRGLREGRTPMQRLVLLIMLATLGFAGPVLAETGDRRQDDQDDPGAREVKVMVRNLYFGADLAPAIAAKTLPEFIGAVTGIFATVQASAPSARVAAVAEEIAAAKPDLVGLQEVALWRSQLPPDFAPAPNATTVEFDFLQILLAELAARGEDYEVVAVHVTNDIEAPALTPAGPCCREIRFTDREVILVRAGRRHRDPIELSNVQEGTFTAQLPLTLPGGLVYVQKRGWLSVDVRLRGAQFRFITSHLETDAAAPIQEQQGLEIVAGPAASRLPVIFVCDCNSRADGTGTATYAGLLGAGFEDTWFERHPHNPGLTCCQDENLRNEESKFDRRIDLIMLRGRGQVLRARVVGDEPDERTVGGLWPSDHAGVVARLRLQR